MILSAFIAGGVVLMVGALFGAALMRLSIGPEGPKGDPGPKGDRGAMGPQGMTGPRGMDGTDVHITRSSD